MQSGTLNRSHKENVFDTFTKKKKLNKKEVEELTNEGKNAIESPLKKMFSNVEDYKIVGTKYIVDKSEMNREEIKLLFDIIMDWLNKILEPKRIVVKDIAEDFSDGQILQELAQHFCGEIAFTDVAASETAQKHRIKVILDHLHVRMGIQEDEIENLIWNVEEIYNKNLVATISLLIKMIQTFSPEVRLPLNVNLNVTKVTNKDGEMQHTRQTFVITGMYEGDSRENVGKDSFDTLFATAANKIDDVRESLLNFVNGHFKKLDIEIQNMEEEFKDGIYLIYLLGLLGNFFVPTYAYNLPANDFGERRENIVLVYNLMDEFGMPPIKSSPDEIILGDLKATMRVLYTIYCFYKD